MRKWTAAQSSGPTALAGKAMAGLIGSLGDPGFETHLLECLHPVVPAASFSVYQTGSACTPRRFLSGSRGIPDTTRQCWQAYLTGPHLTDNTLVPGDEPLNDMPMLCHITAQEVPEPHRTRVYEAHGMAERVSVVHQQQGRLLAVNLYRHQHQPAFSDSQVSGFENLAPALLALVKKHIALIHVSQPSATALAWQWRARLKQLSPGLTPRETDVCVRLLSGMTQDGIAADLNLSVPTVKTYRNRAFERLGIHFRNELFALMFTR